MLLALLAGFVPGVLSQACWPVLPSVPGLLAAVLPAAGAAVFAPPGWRRLLALSVLGMALGAGWAAQVAGDVIAARLPESREARDDVVEGVIRRVQWRADGSTSWELVVERLPWYPERGRWTLRIDSYAPSPPAEGERWRLSVRLKPPHASQNPGAADFERYLLARRTVASGYLRENGALERLAPARGFAAWRARMMEAALPLMGAGAGDLAADDATTFARAVLPALVLDERSWLAPSQWRLLANTGTAHLVAISGLHVALLWGCVLWLCTRLLRRRAGSLRFRTLPVLLALSAAGLYAALAGMPLPAARATLMLAAVSLLVLRDGRAPAWRILLLATFVVLLLDPLAAHDAGFWLSHGAVGLLLLLADLQRRCPGPAGHARRVVAAGWLAVRVQILLSLLMAPLLFALFGTLSLSSVAANIPAIPLVNLLALPFALAGFLLAPAAPWLADPCLDLAAAVLAVLWKLLAWLDSFSWMSPLAVPGFDAAGILLFTAACAALLLARQPAPWLAAGLLAVLAWPRAEILPPGTAQVCVLDVGQGLAVSARTARHAVLYDAGPGWGDSDAGRAVVVPVLRAQGVGRLDLLVLSHHDVDHVGGRDSVLAALPATEILAGDARSLEGVTGRRCDDRGRRRYDDVDISWLPGAQSGNDNDRSCVLRIAAGGHAVLLPGDIGRRRELELVAQFPQADALAADVLVYPHHGSNGSGSLTFLHRVSPREVVFAAGYRNRFRHPGRHSQARVRLLGARAWSTATSGAICFRLDEKAPQPVGWRALARRYWRED